MTTNTLHQENEAIRVQLRQSQANLQLTVPVHHVAIEGEHSLQDVNRYTNTVGQSHQRSLSQPVELCQQHSFVDGILNDPLPLGQKPLNIDQYDGTIHPDEHLEVYITQVNLYTYNNVILCRVFPSSLNRPALTWWHQLSSHTIDSFVSQPTSRWDKESKINKPKRSSPREKTSGVTTNVYSRKTLEKPKRGL